MFQSTLLQMSDEAVYSKRAVSRAGIHLAQRLLAVQRGRRSRIVDEDDPHDVHARTVVEWWRSVHVPPMLAVRDLVARFAPELQLGDDERLQAVSFRAKRFDTTIEKLTREPGKLADMADIGGVRAVVNTQEEADSLAAQIMDLCDVRPLRDWVRSPRPTGYRALHLHVRERGHMIEVQLRTMGQDAWANIVEEESRYSGLNYKAGRGHREVLDFLRGVADLLAAVELGDSQPGLATQIAGEFEHAEALLKSPTLRSLLP